MLALGANPSATYSADLSGVPIRRQRVTPISVAAGCTAYQTRHNRVPKRRATYCRSYRRVFCVPLRAPDPDLY